FRAALRLKPDLDDAQFQLGNLLHETGALKQAETTYRDLLRRQPGHATASLEQNLGIALGQQYRFDDAIAAYARAQAANPGLAHLDHRRACMLQDVGRTDEALAL